MRAKCSECSWSFDVVALPMPVDRAAAAMMQAHCPMCGNAARNTIDAPRLLSGAEYAHVLDRELKVSAASLTGGG